MKITLTATNKRQLEDVLKVSKRQKEKPFSVDFFFNQKEKVCVVGTTDYTITAWFILPYKEEPLFETCRFSADDIEIIMSTFSSSKEVKMSFNKTTVVVTDEKGKMKKEAEYIDNARRVFDVAIAESDTDESYVLESDVSFLRDISNLTRNVVDMNEPEPLYHIGDVRLAKDRYEFCAAGTCFAVSIDRKGDIECLKKDEDEVRFSFSGYVFQYLSSISQTGTFKIKKENTKVRFKFKDFYVEIRSTEDNRITFQGLMSVFEVFKRFVMLPVKRDEFIGNLMSSLGVAQYLIFNLKEKEMNMKNYFTDQQPKAKYSDLTTECDYIGIHTKIYMGKKVLDKLNGIKFFLSENTTFSFTAGSRGTDSFGIEEDGLKVICMAVALNEA